MYGTSNANTLLGIYGPAREVGRKVVRWKFDRGCQYEAKAVRRIYDWAECKVLDIKLTNGGRICKKDQEDIAKVLKEFDIPVMQKVVVSY